MNILFLITARGGSKGVPNKNIIELGEISLVGYKAISATHSKYCSRIIVSTDNEAIAENARKYNVEVPFIRPYELALDHTPSIDVIIHAMEWIEKNDQVMYDAIFLLEPSSPFANYEDINNSVELFINKEANAVLGVRKVEPHSSFVAEVNDDLWMKAHYEKICNLEKIRRQDMNPEYTMNGAIYLAKWDFLKKNRSFHSERTLAYIMPYEKSVEIDSMHDLEIAKYYIDNNLIDMSYWKG